MHVRRVSRLSYESLETRTCLSAVGFALHDIDNQPGGSSNMIFADLDGDGDQDLVSDHFWRPNHGDGTFADAIQILPRDSVDAIEAGDIDGDGDLDLLVTRREVQTIVAWHENLDGQGAFGSNQDIGTLPDWSLRHDRWRASLVDINDDQLLDVVVSSFAAGSQMTWHANLGSAGFAVAAAVPGVDFPAAFLESADLDEDGDQDLVLRTADATLLMQAQENSFAETARMDVIAQAALVTDLGNNGLDLLLSTPEATLRYEAAAGGGFVQTDSVTTWMVEPRSTTYLEVSVANMDGDGMPDLIVRSNDTYSNYVYWIEVQDNRFTEATAIPVDDTPFYFHYAIANPDGDELSEILGPYKAWQYDADSDRFTERIYSNRRLGMVNTGTQTVDIDGDGDLDFVAVQSVDDCFGSYGPCYHRFSWYENLDGRGSFGERREILEVATSRFDFSTQVHAGDMNADGQQDLVLTYSASGRKSQVFLQQDGEFLADQILADPITTMADLNSDGQTDLVWQREDHFELSFEPNRTLYGTSDSPLIDWDHDGDLDFVVVLDQHFVWYENLGVGDFSEPKEIFADPNLDVRFMDINGDSLPDALVSDVRQNRVSVRLNTELVLAPEVVIANDMWFVNHLGNVNGLGGAKLVMRTSTNQSRDYFVYSFGVDGSVQSVTNLSPTLALIRSAGDIDNDGDDDLLTNGLVWYESRPLGDANGDSVFDSSDFVTVFQAGEFEDSLDGNSTFQEGDWNGDGDFDTADLVAAFAYGSFVRQAVPVSPMLPHWCVSPDDPRLQR